MRKININLQYCTKKIKVHSKNITYQYMLIGKELKKILDNEYFKNDYNDIYTYAKSELNLSRKKVDLIISIYNKFNNTKFEVIKFNWSQMLALNELSDSTLNALKIPRLNSMREFTANEIKESVEILNKKYDKTYISKNVQTNENLRQQENTSICFGNINNYLKERPKSNKIPVLIDKDLLDRCLYEFGVKDINIVLKRILRIKVDKR